VASVAGSTTVQILISGRVQGVGYRNWTARRATQAGLSGWVRNLPSGEVEAVFSGAVVDVAAMIEACHQGPPHARVASVETLGAVEPVTGPFSIR
jgi:acylphosphatase